MRSSKAMPGGVTSSTGPTTVTLIGIGMGAPAQLTAEALAALHRAEAFLVVEKGPADPLAQARRALLDHCGVADTPVLVVTDPSRDRTPTRTSTTSGYEQAVTDWHAARVAAFESAMRGADGELGLLVWGDPAFYDSTIRIIDAVRDRFTGGFDTVVVPGISAVSLLAARHRIVLHEIGQPIHITTGRRLAEAVAAGQDNIVVMLDGDLACRAIDGDWQIWWGANIGTDHEALVVGVLAERIAEIESTRAEVRRHAGWVMDTYLLRRCEAIR